MSIKFSILHGGKMTEKLVAQSLEEVKKCVAELDNALDDYYQHLLQVHCDPNIKQAIVNLEVELSDFKKRVCY